MSTAFLVAQWKSSYRYGRMQHTKLNHAVFYFSWGGTLKLMKELSFSYFIGTYQSNISRCISKNKVRALLQKYIAQVVGQLDGKSQGPGSQISC
jgi:hypothetical protein